MPFTLRNTVVPARPDSTRTDQLPDFGKVIDCGVVFALCTTTKVAAESLLQQGIKGIRYFDQGSRSAGGTQNYVVFDPKEVKILEKGLLK